jgi:hypothetical protein
MRCLPARSNPPGRTRTAGLTRGDLCCPTQVRVDVFLDALLMPALGGRPSERELGSG